MTFLKSKIICRLASGILRCFSQKVLIMNLLLTKHVACEANEIRAAQRSFSHSGRAENGARGKGGSKGRGSKAPFFPFPHSPPSTFLLSPHFYSFARSEFRSRRAERLLRRLPSLRPRWLDIDLVLFFFAYRIYGPRRSRSQSINT